MKKLLIMLVLLTMAVAANAATVGFVVDPADEKVSYEPSDIITINLVADFDVFAVSVSIGANGGTAEALGALNPLLATAQAPYTNGTFINDLGILIYGVSGGAPFGAPLAPAGEALYTFEFHVPDVPPSTIIIIDDVTGMNPEGGPMTTSIAGQYYSPNLNDVGSLAIHVIPEPMTMSLLAIGGLFLRRRK